MEKLKTSPNIVVLQELQGLLHDSGIQSHIEENSSPYVDASGNTITYTLLVHSGDIDKAIQITKEFDKVADQPTDYGWCPECGAEDLSKEVVRLKHSSIAFPILGVFAIAVALIVPLGVILGWVFIIGGICAIIQYFRGHTEERYVCNNCGHRFKRY